MLLIGLGSLLPRSDDTCWDANRNRIRRDVARNHRSRPYLDTSTDGHTGKNDRPHSDIAIILYRDCCELDSTVQDWLFKSIFSMK